MDIKKPQLVKVEAFAVFLRNSSATPSHGLTNGSIKKETISKQ